MIRWSTKTVGSLLGEDLDIEDDSYFINMIIL